MNPRLIGLVIPAALLLAIIYAARATWGDIQAKRWAWAGIGVLTMLTSIAALILIVLVLSQPAY